MELEKISERYMTSDSGHDFSHVMRVRKLAEKIGAKEKADLSILLPAVLLHDIKFSKKTFSQRKKSADESSELAEKILRKLNYPKDKIEKILYCIKVHSFSKSLKAKTLEAKILQDSDRLDAIGAIGIARVFAVGQNLKIPFYEIKDPFARKRKLNDSKNSLDHFYIKLLKLKNRMNTKTGKKIAIHRHKFLTKFLKQLKKEI